MPFDTAPSASLPPVSRLPASAWPAFLDDVRAAIPGEPRRVSRLIEDGIRDLNHQLGLIEAEIDRLHPGPVTLTIWMRRRQLLRARRAELKSLLPVRADWIQTLATPDPSDPQLSSMRRRVREAVATLQLLHDPGGRENPSCQEVERMWEVVIGWTVAVTDPISRRVLWATGSGIPHRIIAKRMGGKPDAVARLERDALMNLQRWLLRHGS